MTVLRPKPSTLFALAAFIVIVLAGCLLLIYPFFKTAPLASWRVIVAGLLAPLGLGLLARMVWTYKKVELQKDRLRVSHPLRPGGNWQVKLKELNWWKEERVNASGSEYREVVLLAEGKGRLKVSMHEYSNYQKLLNALVKYAGNKRV